MPQFTLHRNFVLRTTKGHTIKFVKGEPAWVPPFCVPDVVAIGAVPVEGPVDILGDEQIEAPAPLTPDQREAKIRAAFETLLARNDRGDFTASGLPHSKKVSEIAGFEVPNRERDASWQAYMLAKAESA